ncbi:E3 ubiquitin-protein ligase TRIM71-like [Lytechinus pictus]|uniref:E3 ubiquitin-protein ligase TRIM71-like n=1 Tax=Lytechinus pictus TaxID=7653 RepID=UPI0030BA063F
MASTSAGQKSYFVENNQMISELEDQIQCAICQERLNNPRVLDCLHSFCEDCLKRSHRLSTREFMDSDSESDEIDYPVIKCSYCRAVTELPESGVSGLKADFRANRIREILDAFEKRKRKFAESEYCCEICPSSGESAPVPASDYCQNCGQLFCEQCSRVHRRLTDTKDHFVVKVADLMVGKEKLRKTEHENATFKMCRQHAGELLKYFCRVCKIPVCLLCSTFGNCISHKKEVSQLGEAVTEMSGIVEILTDQLKHRQRLIKEMLTKTNAVIMTTENRKKEFIQQMIVKHQAFISQIKQKMQKEVDQRDRLFNGKISKVRGIGEEIQKMNKKSDDALHLVDNIRREPNAHGTDLVTVLGCLQGALQIITSEQINAMNRDLSKVEDDVQQMRPTHMALREPTRGAVENMEQSAPGRRTPLTRSANDQGHQAREEAARGFFLHRLPYSVGNTQSLNIQHPFGVSRPAQERQSEPEVATIYQGPVGIGTRPMGRPLQARRVRSISTILSGPEATSQSVDNPTPEATRRFNGSSFTSPQTIADDLHHRQSTAPVEYSTAPFQIPLEPVSFPSCSPAPHAPGSPTVNDASQSSVNEQQLLYSGAVAPFGQLPHLERIRDIPDMPDLGPDLSF